MAVTIDEISAVTEKLYLPLIADNVMNSNPLMARFWQRGPKLRGGLGIHTPLMYQKVGSAGAIRGFEPMTIDADDQLTAVVFDWKEYYAAIVLSKRETLQNAGEAEMLSHISAKSQMAEMTLRDLMGTGLYSDGTLLAGRAIDGLEAVMSLTNTYPNSGGASVGIDRTVETWWQAKNIATWTLTYGGGALSTTTAFLGAQRMVGRCTEQPNSPTMILTTQIGFDTFFSAYEDNQRFEDSGMASLGFETILFRRIPIVVDSHIVAGRMYFLNENFLQLITHQDENFRFAPFREPINQKAMVGFIFWTGNLVCNDPRFQGVVLNFAA